ncbi:unnamed protein product [Peronospora belbahrii]|uniref:Uncharacterized protein n=1 Tax=Peronospora belbahrii TaxID=622444 RepID=A0AAU9L8P8_9STRA|nr:unnamed protein product [Peronospora belbahrii]
MESRIARSQRLVCYVRFAWLFVDIASVMDLEFSDVQCYENQDHFVRTKPFDLLASCVTGSPCANCNVTLSCSTTARTIFGWQSTHEYLEPASLNDSTVI